VVQDVTIDKSAAGGLMGLEELSSSWLLLQRTARKHQIMMKNTVFRARDSACPLSRTALI